MEVSGEGEHVDTGLGVLFLPSSWYPTRENPASGIFVRKHAQAVARHCRVAVLFVRGVATLAREQQLEVAEEHGLLTVRVTYRRPRSRALDVLRYLRAARVGMGEVRRRAGRFDLHHLHVAPHAGLILAQRLLWRQTPYLFTEHWTGYFPEDGRFRGRLRRRLTRWLVSGAGGVTVVSEAARHAMEAHGLAGCYTVVPNVVDTDLFTPCGERSSGLKTLVHVSSLDPEQKNPAGLLRAVAGLAARRGDFRLVVVGGGPGRPAAEEQAGRLGLLGRQVLFLGALDEGGVAEQLRAADAAVLFSNFENSPCVIAEALSCGVPVVATRVGGVAEHVRERFGLLVEPGDEDALGRCLALVLDDPERFDREAMRVYAVERFSPERVSERFMAVYAEAVGGRRTLVQGARS